jgi:hypothetical protein
LKLIKGLSREICVVCNFQLKDFCIFKRNVLTLQKGLLKYFSGESYSQRKSIKHEHEYVVNVKTEVEEIYESSGFLEPEVKIDDEKDENRKLEFLDFNEEMNFGELVYIKDCYELVNLENS